VILRGVLEVSNRAPAASEQINDQHCDGDYQQKVDQASGDVKAET
jgi:hypothetical protein